MRRAIAALVLGASTAGAQISAPWFPDDYIYIGNIVRGATPGHLLVGINDVAPRGNFQIRVGESDDDGRTWRITRLVARDSAANFFDPALGRLPDGTLLLTFHWGAGVQVMQSTDDGATWRRDTILGPPGSVEGYWRALPPATPGGPQRMALVYTIVRPNRTSTYWIRTTIDGKQWTRPDSIGDAGAIWDITRVAIGPVRDSIVPIVYAYRRTPDDSDQIMSTSLDARTLAPRSPARVIARVSPNFRGMGVFPVILACPDGEHVLFSTWNPGAPVSALWEMTVKDGSVTHPPAQFYTRDHMNTGFGRIWFVSPWHGTPQVVWVELPDAPHSHVLSMMRPDLAGCAD